MMLMNLEIVRRIDNGDLKKIMEENGMDYEEDTREKKAIIKQKNEWLKENGLEYAGGSSKRIVKIGTNETV